MPLRVAFVLVLACVVACDPRLEYPSGVIIACTSDASCPTDDVCINSVCTPRGGVDSAGTALLSPNDGQLLTLGESATLVWRPVLAAAFYDVEVRRVGGEALPGSPFRVYAPENFLELEPLPEPVSYEWSVRANTTGSQTAVERRRLEVVGDTLYVYCPPERTDCRVALGESQAGNATSPFTDVQAAVDRAQALRLTAVNVATRPSGLAYEPGVRLSGTITLTGGYDPAFTARDDSARTLVRDLQLALSINGTGGAVAVSGFAFEVVSTDADQRMDGVAIAGVPTSVDLARCAVALSGTARVATGVRVGDLATATTLSELTVSVSGGSARTVGVAIDASVVTLSESAITVTGAHGTTFGITVVDDNSAVEVHDTTVVASGDEDVGGILAGPFQRLVVRGSSFAIAESGAAPRFARGVDLNYNGIQTGLAVIEGNSISVRGSLSADGFVTALVPMVATNNLVRTSGCPAYARAVSFSGFDVFAQHFFAHNTVVVGAATNAREAFNFDLSDAHVYDNLVLSTGTCPSLIPPIASESVQLELLANVFAAGFQQVSPDNTLAILVGTELVRDLDANDLRPRPGVTLGTSGVPLAQCTSLEHTTALPEWVAACGLMTVDRAGVARGTSATPGAFQQ